MRTRRDSSLPRRFPRPVLLSLSRRACARRGRRAEKRKTFWCPCPLPDTAGAFRRATCACAAATGACYFAAIFAHHAGPRFRRQCPASPTTDVSQSDVGGLRLDPQGSKTRRSSASSWQGLVVGTGGAPAPPGCLDANQTRGRRTSSRLYARLAKRPSVDEVVGTLKEVRSAGISFMVLSPLNQRHTGESRYPFSCAARAGPRLPPG